MTISLVPAVHAEENGDVHVIALSSTEEADGSYSHTAIYDGAVVTEYDYTWHADPSTDHKEVKNAPAEYYTGTQPGDEAVYIAHDIYYYPQLSADGFQKVNYDGDQEWAYYYTAQGYEDYIFSTLPVSGSSVPTGMMHSEAEAYQNAVLHITQPGTYRLEGEWHGQIWIDLGDTDSTFADESAKVTVILNGVDVTCTVAPALVFYSVYECDNTWESQTSWSAAVDTADAGANVIIADGTENNFTGANVYRMLKTKYKSDDEQSGTGVKLQKKMRKLDGAFYSYVSMNVTGEAVGSGVLNIHAGYEGLDSELHLTVNGGNVNIFSQDDGINVNEDGVSVVTINGGSVHILAGLGDEGDGIDSNGYLVINGGTVISMANPNSDSGLDSDCGSYVNGGTVVALGSTMDWARANDDTASGQAVMNLQFVSAQSADEAIILTDLDGKVVFAYDPDKDEVAGSNARWYQGAVISSAALQVGESYLVYVGGDVEGQETAGVYDAATVTGFTSEAKQQCYTGTGVGGFGGMGGGFEGERPDDMPEIPDNGFDPGSMGERPDNAPEPPTGETPQDPNNAPEQPDGETPQNPDGTQAQPNGETPQNPGSGAPELPDGEVPQTPGEMPELPNGDGAQMPGGEQPSVGEAISVFALTSKVNGFSGVRDLDDGSTAQPETPSEDETTVVTTASRKRTTTSTASTNTVSNSEEIPSTPEETSGSTALEQVQSCLHGADCPVSAYQDLDDAQWYHDGVHYCLVQGWMTGTDDGAFSPNVTLTRAMVAQILYRMEGSPAVTGSSGFEDITEGAWYADAVLWAVQNGVTQGCSDTAFQPDQSVTREQLAAMLYRCAQLDGGDLTASGDLTAFDDAEQIDSWAKDAMSWVNGAGLLTGRTSTTLAPQDTATRAEIASILYRFDQTKAE
jgi:hypothetical protein